MRTLSLALSLSLLASCTTWSTTTVLGSRREVGRHLRGMPSYATTSSSSMSAGFVGARSRHVAVAGVDAGTESFTRTHCVQEADITYEQPFELQPVIEGRPKDILAGAVLGLVGLTIIGLAHAHTSTVFEPGDPLYTEPPSTLSGDLFGGAFIAAGVGVIVYSFGALPKGPAPDVKSGVNQWVATEIVEADGCDPATLGQR